MANMRVFTLSPIFFNLFSYNKRKNVLNYSKCKCCTTNFPPNSPKLKCGRCGSNCPGQTAQIFPKIFHFIAIYLLQSIGQSQLHSGKFNLNNLRNRVQYSLEYSKVQSIVQRTVKCSVQYGLEYSIVQRTVKCSVQYSSDNSKVYCTVQFRVVYKADSIITWI